MCPKIATAMPNVQLSLVKQSDTRPDTAAEPFDFRGGADVQVMLAGKLKWYAASSNGHNTRRPSKAGGLGKIAVS